MERPNCRRKSPRQQVLSQRGDGDFMGCVGRQWVPDIATSGDDKPRSLLAEMNFNAVS